MICCGAFWCNGALRQKLSLRKEADCNIKDQAQVIPVFLILHLKHNYNWSNWNTMWIPAEGQIIPQNTWKKYYVHSFICSVTYFRISSARWFYACGNDRSVFLKSHTETLYIKLIGNGGIASILMPTDWSWAHSLLIGPNIFLSSSLIQCTFTLTEVWNCKKQTWCPHMSSSPSLCSLSLVYVSIIP